MAGRRITLGIAAAVWVAAAVVGQPPGPPAAPAPAASRSGAVVVGTAGCAARGCHGGPVTDSTGELVPPNSRNACTYWVRYDKHQDAYQLLKDDKSRRMIDLLAKGGGWAKPAAEEPRCLACHATPALATAPISDESRRLWAEGVGCDACHTKPGAATDDWFDAHKKGWAPGGLADCFAGKGMHWLGNTRERAATCAGCHVGAPAADGVPAREVTHDLIAAGHPRLNFEYATYLAALPPHWTERQRSPDGTGATSPQPRPPGFAAHAWFAGQVETTKAGLGLVADQAHRGLWPELAALNCYACHHDLPPKAGGTDWRQQRTDARKTGAGRATFAGLSDPLRQLLTAADPAFNDFDRKLTPKTAFGYWVKLDQLAANPPVTATDPAAGRAIIRGLKLTDRDPSRLDWDDAAQTYYALEAASRSRGAPPDAIDATLAEVADALRLPRGEVTFNSPREYRPDKVAAGLKKLPPLFETWYAKQNKN